MIHKAKCPKCKAELDLDTGDKIEGSIEIAITKCVKCGFPLINKNQGDNWEVLKPSDMMSLPKELQFLIAEQLLAPEEIEGMKQFAKVMKDAMSSTTPLDRARIFPAEGVCTNKGCVLVLEPMELGKLSSLVDITKNAKVRDALHHIITTDYEQKTTDN